MGSLLCWTVVFTPIGTAASIALSHVVDKSKAENTVGGIKYDLAVGQQFESAPATEPIVDVDEDELTIQEAQMDTILNTIIQYVAEILGLAIATAIGILGTWILNKIRQNKNLTNISAATEQVIEATQETVRRLQQTLVESYKEAQGGKLTPEQILELKQKTLDITLQQLGSPTLNLLAAAKIDVANIITNAAEAFINEMKENGFQREVTSLFFLLEN